MTKKDIEARLNEINESNPGRPGYTREARINDWKNYGKDRTYYSIVQTCENSKHYSEVKYGYYDNVADQYVPASKTANLEADSTYDFSGTKYTFAQ